jgi:hypothetical protein
MMLSLEKLINLQISVLKENQLMVVGFWGEIFGFLSKIVFLLRRS